MIDLDGLIEAVGAVTLSGTRFSASAGTDSLGRPIAPSSSAIEFETTIFPASAKECERLGVGFTKDAQKLVTKFALRKDGETKADEFVYQTKTYKVVAVEDYGQLADHYFVVAHRKIDR